MHAKPRDIDDVHVEEGPEPCKRQQAELRQMLLIDGVELVLFDQVLGPGQFEYEGAVIGKQNVHALHEIMQVADMVEGVGRADHLRRFVLFQHFGGGRWVEIGRSEEHTSDLQSLMRLSSAVFCLKNKKRNTTLPT